MNKQYLDQLIHEEVRKVRKSALSETAGKQVGEEFFKDVMDKLGVTPTPEKFKFFKAWQRAEGTRAENNPLATTKKVNDPGATNLNTVGVKNYSSYDIGVNATADTLKLPYYTELVNKLKQDDITAADLANTTGALKTWSGGDGKYVARVLGSKTTDNASDSADYTASNWPLKDVANVLEKMGGTLSKSSNPEIGYRYDVEMSRGLTTDVHRFYDDYTGKTNTGKTFTYKLKGNEIEITYDDATSEPYVMKSTDKPGEIVLDPQSTSTSTIIDWIQTAADWAGFIPGYGDIIDAINAMIYFARGKTFEGVLSLIGAIPFIGSIFSVSLKTGFKLVKGSATKFYKALFSKNTTQVAEILSDFSKRGILPDTVLRELAKHGDPLAAKLINSKKYISKVAPDGVIKYIDEMADTITTLSKSSNKAIEFTTKLSKVPVEPKVLRKVLGTVSLGSSEIIYQLMKVANPNLGKTINTTTALAAAGFTKRLMKDPEMLAAMIKTVPGSKLGKQSAENVIQQLKNMNPTQYAEAVKSVTSSKALQGNPYWTAYVGDAIGQAKRAFDPSLTYQISKWSDNIRLSKFVDIAYNEGQEALYQMGLTNVDDKSAVILPSIGAVLSQLPGDASKTIDKVTNDVVNTAKETRDSADTAYDLLKMINQGSN